MMGHCIDRSEAISHGNGTWRRDMMGHGGTWWDVMSAGKLRQSHGGRGGVGQQAENSPWGTNQRAPRSPTASELRLDCPRTQNRGIARSCWEASCKAAGVRLFHGEVPLKGRSWLASKCEPSTPSLAASSLHFFFSWEALHFPLLLFPRTCCLIAP